MWGKRVQRVGGKMKVGKPVEAQPLQDAGNLGKELRSYAVSIVKSPVFFTWGPHLLKMRVAVIQRLN